MLEALQELAEYIKPYNKSNYYQENLGFYKKIDKLGGSLNLDLPRINKEEMEKFINNNYCNLFKNKDNRCIPPIASCSIISSNKPLLNLLEKTFNMKVYTIYGYIKTEDRKFHFFTDGDINQALTQKKFFKNHHAFILFENGQLLDLTFINTLMRVKEKYEMYEYIFSDAHAVYAPNELNLIYTLSSKSYFNYIPMYIGDLFSEDVLSMNSMPIDY